MPELEAWSTDQGQPAYRGRQISAWLYTRRVARFAAMTNLPASLRERWQREFPVHLPVIGLVRESRDGTEKYRV